MSHFFSPATYDEIEHGDYVFRMVTWPAAHGAWNQLLLREADDGSDDLVQVAQTLGCRLSIQEMIYAHHDVHFAGATWY